MALMGMAGRLTGSAGIRPAATDQPERKSVLMGGENRPAVRAV
jgi:hypothetical protein